MGIFSWKSKAKKRDDKKDQKEATEEKPKVAYKHLPTHAASDSAGQGGRADSTQDRHQIALANRRRIANSMYDSTLSNAAFAQEIAHNMAHGTPSPASLAPGSPRFLSQMQRNYSEEVFSNSERRPIAGPSVQRSQSATGYRRVTRDSSSDYFHQSRSQFPFDSRSITNGKRPVSNMGLTYGTPQYFSDSGYESAEGPSALHSRAPSEQNLDDYTKRSSLANNSGFLLPELTLSQEPMAGISSTEVFSEGMLKNQGDVSPVDINADSMSVGSHKSTGSTNKRTRFQDELDQSEQAHKESGHSTTSTPQLPESSEVTADAEVPSESLAVAVPIESTAAVRLHEPKPRTVRPSLPTKLSPSQSYAGPANVESPRKASLPPLSILEGFKVNKKSKVLDEEGDLIGELVEGDLLDCIRQKANANGEVLDESGRVVGIVRTVLPRVAAKQDEELTRGRRPSLPQVHSDPEAQRLATSTKQDELTPIATTQSRHFAESQIAKRPIRNNSERSLSELSKTYARPAMSSVPENNVPEDDRIPDSPGVFGYKGEIPMFDGPQPNMRMRSKSPGSMPYLRPALAGSHASSMMFTPVRPVAGMNSRRATTHYAGGVSPVRHPGFPAVRRSQFSGFDVSPNNSEAGTDASSNSDDGRMPTIGGHTRASSIRTTGTATTSKPRTYFTHTGKVTVDPNAPKPKKTERPKEAAAAAGEKKPEQQKKRRMSLSFGKKSKAAA